MINAQDCLGFTLGKEDGLQNMFKKPETPIEVENIETPDRYI
jgi:hypothetical protein